MTARKWIVRLSLAARADFQNVVRWTEVHFGLQQSSRYAEMLYDALALLNAGPRTIGVHARPEIGANVYTLHVGRGGRQARHLILFRVGEQHDPPIVEVLRVLHDSMDLPRHIPKEE